MCVSSRFPTACRSTRARKARSTAAPATNVCYRPESRRTVCVAGDKGLLIELWRKWQSKDKPLFRQHRGGREMRIVIGCLAALLYFSGMPAALAAHTPPSNLVRVCRSDQDPLKANCAAFLRGAVERLEIGAKAGTIAGPRHSDPRMCHVFSYSPNTI